MDCTVIIFSILSIFVQIIPDFDCSWNYFKLIFTKIAFFWKWDFIMFLDFSKKKMFIKYWLLFFKNHNRFWIHSYRLYLVLTPISCYIPEIRPHRSNSSFGRVANHWRQVSSAATVSLAVAILVYYNTTYMDL